ncbi:MAG: dihydrodipicolinate synthase family protein [Acidimicrobiales bacterium]
MTEPIFLGVGVALITLFDDDLAVDVGATAAHARTLVDLGVSAVLVAGSTGEPESLTRDERSALIAGVREALPPAVPVLALSPPFAPDPRPYYDALAAACEVPLLAYHFPDRSSPGIPLEALVDLPVAGLKDSSGSVDRLLSTFEAWDGPIWPGSSALVCTAAALGCPGVILALANAEPDRCVAAFAGGGDGAAQRRLTPSHQAQRGRFPHGIKALTAARFGTSTRTRMG